MGRVDADHLFHYPLPAVEQAAYRALGLGPDASNEEVAAAKSATLRRIAAEKDELEASLQRIDEAAHAEMDPELREKRRRVEELQARLHELNQQALEKPESRLAYDRAHPPLALLKLEECGTDDFLRGATCLHLLRVGIARFLEARGERVFHPSDLTREDFVSDFTANPILDGDGDG